MLNLSIYIDTHDWWVGYYRGENYHFICPLPTLVVRIAKTTSEPVVLVPEVMTYAVRDTQSDIDFAPDEEESLAFGICGPKHPMGCATHKFCNH